MAVLAQTRRGDSMICEARSHIFFNEHGHVAALCGVLPLCIAGPRGRMNPADIIEQALSDPVLNAPTRLICLENTHNAHGGCCLDTVYMASIRQAADRLKVPIHVDGARIFNAAVALNVPACALAAGADSITFCLSKGLGCPFGSVVAGSRDFIRETRAARQMVGGGMRQAGVMAAAGVVALQSMIGRLRDDHENAYLLAHGLKDAGLEVELENVETSMIFFRIPAGGPDPLTFHAALSRNGVLCNPPRRNRFRMVTHYGIAADDIRTAAQAVSRTLAR